MQIKYVCTHWGFEKEDFGVFLDRLLHAGYNCLEAYFPVEYATIYQKVLNRKNIPFIPQHHLPNPALPFETYKKNYEADLLRLADLGPVHINAHTGRDYYSFDENCQLIEKAFHVIQKTGCKIFHEIHRGRFSFHPLILRQYLEKFPEIELTADFSHWCVVTESLLERQQEYLSDAINHSSYIHARIGYQQGPQVNDPQAPEWQNILNLFLSWWKKIKSVSEYKGKDKLYICPEFGPSPYMPLAPYTCLPLSSQWDANVFMMTLLKNGL